MSAVPPDEKQMNLSHPNLETLMDVQLPVSICFGETEMILDDILKLGVGSVIELNCNVDDPVQLMVNGKHFASGQVVAVDGFYGIRIASMNPRRRADDVSLHDETGETSEAE
jgi:flagellar motor switch protein FliN/FliY